MNESGFICQHAEQLRCFCASLDVTNHGSRLASVGTAVRVMALFWCVASEQATAERARFSELTG